MKELGTVVSVGALLASPVAFAQQQGQQDQGVQQTQQAAERSQSDTIQGQLQGTQANANRFVVGRLVDARSISVDGDQGPSRHRLLKLESRSGEQIIVDMGPSRSPSAMGFKQGDLIVAMGKSARINGRPVLYAHYVGELQDLAGRDLSQGDSANR
jgi:hypothetical protein